MICACTLPPSPSLVLEAECCQHICGCRQGRETGRNPAHPAATHWPADLCQNAAVGTTVSHARHRLALSCFSQAPWGEQRATANSCSIPAFLHHKSYLVCTKRCWDPLPGQKKKKKWRPLPAAQMKQSSPAVKAGGL